MYGNSYRAAAAVRGQVPPFHVMSIVSEAAERQRITGDVISLAAGQPSSPAPRPVLAAAAAALHQRGLGYTEQLGLKELRESIASHYKNTYATTVDPHNVVVTTGASSALALALLAGFDAGEAVAVARPGYPAYRNLLSAFGCVVVDLECNAANDFRPTVEMLDALDVPIGGLIVASPANPTGATLASDELAAITSWCTDNGVLLISDEIYHGIQFGQRPSTSWEFGRESIVLNSFSKFWCMTGWRLGWMLVPEGLLPSVDALTGNLSLCPPALSQYAALEAFSDQSYCEVGAHLTTYRKNRSLLLDGLGELGITRLAPAEGAFYVYADISDFGVHSVEWSRQLLEDTGVAVVPGIDFDPINGHDYIRLSYGGSTRDIAEAVRRISAWVA